MATVDSNWSQLLVPEALSSVYKMMMQSLLGDLDGSPKEEKDIVNEAVDEQIKKLRKRGVI